MWAAKTVAVLAGLGGVAASIDYDRELQEAIEEEQEEVQQHVGLFRLSFFRNAQAVTTTTATRSTSSVSTSRSTCPSSWAPYSLLS